MLRESLHFLNEIGIENIAHHNATRAKQLRDALSTLGTIEVADPGPRPSPIVVFAPRDRARTPDLQRALADARVHCAFREGRFRAAFHVYNGASCVERVVEVVRRLGGAR